MSKDNTWSGDSDWDGVTPDSVPTGAFSVCECGHAVIDHQRFSDHDKCTIGECECDRVRPIHPTTTGEVCGFTGNIIPTTGEHGVKYEKCEGCGDSIPGIIKTPTGLIHELCMRDEPDNPTTDCYAKATQSKGEVIAAAISKAVHKNRDGNWIDEDGACKVCDGEIPDGHTNNCDIWKLDEQLAAEREKYDAFEKYALEQATEADNAIQECHAALSLKTAQLAAAVEALKLIKGYVESTTQALGELSTEADVDTLNLIDAALAKIGK